uniref:BKRF1 encodes EBNA-1 protein-like n=1 Tax=Oryza sativa subsp. japonica TaxID=39947 RepID=Q69T04_ORYSJ|nr:BKRF1 encodes EBNA-1 protein-like [Oryza sativa Japonica Group]BAD35928.1 BKRF1 encodes EBNA-1 protein-like [Oryza sativa Japonica Group]
MERPARHGGVPAKFGQRGGLAGEEDGAVVPGEEATTTADALARWHRRLGRYSAGNATKRRRGHRSGEFPARIRGGRGGGWRRSAGEGDGDIRRRTGEAAQAAGGWLAPRKEKEEAGRGGVATGELGKGLKR